jgi:hypothetical protein
MTLSTVVLVALCLALLAGLVIFYRTRQGVPAALPQPVKVKAHRPVREVVSDLDALVSEPIAFRFNGEVHEIKPVSTLELLSFTNAFAELQELNGRADSITVGELVDAYTSVISSVCPSITREHVESMTQAQVAALFQLVMDSVVGRAHAAPGVEPESEDAKKKL